MRTAVFESSPAPSLLPTEQPLSLIDPTGMLVTDATIDLPSTDRLVRALADMTTARRINELASALVRQGRLAVYPSSRGQEACQVAAATVLDDGDWLFPTYRDTAAMVARGVPPAEVLTLLKGDWHSGYDPYRYHVAPQATPLATQLPHAVGVAHAGVLRGESTVTLAMCGDGATSEGDFHEALNFAAVFRAPVVFFVQNNQYAISVPLARQSAAPSLAYKGIGYGVPSYRVDGNDIAALLTILATAVSRARAGGGPQLIEAHTYRMEAHTNADDATRYRDDAEVAEWRTRDPLLRLETYLRAAGAIDEQALEGFRDRANRLADSTRTLINQDIALDPEDLFRYVFSRPSTQLREQRAVLLDELEREDA